MQPFIDQMTRTFGDYVLSIGGAALILIGGWLLALLISALVRKGLERVSFDNRLAERLGFDRSKVNLEAIIGKVVYYIIMLLVLVAVFQALRLTIVTGPLNRLLESVFAYVPNLLAAGGLALLAWILASGLRFIITKALGALKLDDSLTRQIGVSQAGQPPLSETLATIVYWFVWLLFLLPILGALGMQSLVLPIQDMLGKILTYLPNIFAAAIFVLIGWFLARIIRQIVTNFLAAIGADNLGQRVGLAGVTGRQALSGVVGTVVYVLVLIPVITSGLQLLQIEAISTPATNMLNTLLDAVPNIFGAMIILGLTYFVARLVASLVTTLLTSIGFNRVLSLIGLKSDPQAGQRTPAEVVGYLVLVGLMLFATVEAAEILGFAVVADLVARFLSFGGQIILGVVILGIGLYLANVARNVVLGTAGSQARLLSQAAWLAIVILTVAMGLRQMAIADDIINLAFGLLLGAIAVAVALAFGLGSREIAAREVEAMLKRWRAGASE
jgi:hypothetical protein